MSSAINSVTLCAGTAGRTTSRFGKLTISVTAVNDPPSFTPGTDLGTLEDSSLQTLPGWATAISPGPSDESGQTVAFQVASNSNPSLFSAGPGISAGGTLTYTPAANANGTAIVAFTLKDNGDGADTSAPVSSKP